MPNNPHPVPVLIALVLAAACLRALAGMGLPQDPQGYAAAKVGGAGESQTVAMELAARN